MDFSPKGLIRSRESEGYRYRVIADHAPGDYPTHMFAERILTGAGLTPKGIRGIFLGTEGSGSGPDLQITLSMVFLPCDPNADTNCNTIASPRG